jgi:hypothetical protein
MTAPVFHGVLILVGTHYITVTLPPGCIVNFHHNGFNLLIGSIIAVIEAGRIETMSKVPQMRQQPYRAVSPFPQMLFNQVAHRLVQWYFRIAEVIPAAKSGQVKLFNRPQRMKIKQFGQFGQIEKHEKQAIPKFV